jgi:hypothetical protein
VTKVEVVLDVVVVLTTPRAMTTFLCGSALTTMTNDKEGGVEGGAHKANGYSGDRMNLSMNPSLC